MKYIIILLVALSISLATNAEVVREGNTFKTEKTTPVKQDTKTQYTWQDKEGKEYPIYITKKGACYIIKVSKKTGNEYKYYLPKETQEIIKKELGL